MWDPLMSQVAMGEMIKTFWDEFEEFSSKLGSFANKEHIWHSKDIMEGRTHFWHKKNTLQQTEIFGKFACRVTSKILGIGSAERNWGDVKHLKTDKRSHLSPERTAKQATIYGASCVEIALIKKKEAEVNIYSQPFQTWHDEDFEKAFGFHIAEDEENQEQAKPKRIFNAWLEDWEQDCIMKKDVISEAKLLKKYGGLVWHDPDVT